MGNELCKLTFHRYLYASSHYLESAGEPKHPSELAKHECIGFTRGGSWILHHENERDDVVVGGRFVVNTAGMIRRLATLNQGIILLPEEVVADDQSTGRLRRILLQWQERLFRFMPSPTPAFCRRRSSGLSISCVNG